MVRILNEADICLSSEGGTDLRPSVLPCINNHTHTTNGQQQQQVNMDSSHDKEVSAVSVVSELKGNKQVSTNGCSTNNNNNNDVSFSTPSSSPEPTLHAENPPPEQQNNIPIINKVETQQQQQSSPPPTLNNGSTHAISSSSATITDDDSSTDEIMSIDSSSPVIINLNGHQSELRVPIIVIEELLSPIPLVEDRVSSSSSDESGGCSSQLSNGVEKLHTTDEAADSKAEQTDEDVKLCACDDNNSSVNGSPPLPPPMQNGLSKLVPPIVVIQSVEDEIDKVDNDETLKETEQSTTESSLISEDDHQKNATKEVESAGGVSQGGDEGNVASSATDSGIELSSPPCVETGAGDVSCIAASRDGEVESKTNPVDVPTIETPTEIEETKENEGNTAVTVSCEKPTTPQKSTISSSITHHHPTSVSSSSASLFTGKSLLMSARPTPPSSLSTTSHNANYRERGGRNINTNNNGHHHHHCPAHHQNMHHHQHHPQVQTTFQFALSHAHAAAAAANNLSNLLNQQQPQLQYQHGSFPNFPLPLQQQQGQQNLQHHHNHNHQLLNSAVLGPPFSSGIHSMHQLPPTNHNHTAAAQQQIQNHGGGSNNNNKHGGKNHHKFSHQQHHHHHSQQHQNHIPNLNNQLQQGVGGGPAVPMHFSYFSEHQQNEVPSPWGGINNNALCNVASVGGSLTALPPLDVLGAGCAGLGSPSSGPLPTAIIPLPLDPNFPPVVLPSYPANTNTPNTQSTSSGYSTAGHSRSSSPMMGPTTNQQQQQGPGGGLLQHFDNGLLPLPQPPLINASLGVGGGGVNPNFVLAAASTELSMYPQFFPNAIGQFVVYFHINPDVNVSFTVGDQNQVVKGPMTVPLVSTSSSAPIPLPMQVPPGHVVQQIVDENGTLRHVIVSHQPPLIPMPNYAPNSQGQQYYQAGPSGYPSAHFTPMQQVPCPVPSPHQAPLGSNGGMATGGYSSSIPVHAQKDERTQRQFIKLRRKFEQKQQTSVPYNNNGAANPYNNHPASLRKEPTNYAATNGTRKVSNGVGPKSPANGGGGGMEEDGSVGSTGSVTSTGTQDEEEENRTLAMTEMLGNGLSIHVTEVTARSAYVQWSHPDRISESGENKFPDFDVSDNDFRYEVFINEQSRDSRFRSIFIGSSLSCRVKDLKPGSVYGITYCAMLGDVKGNTCTPTNLTTPPAEPEPPTCPRPVSRTRSSITLKWNPPTTDNGSKLNYFLLEYDEGKGGNHFVEAYRGKNKQCTIAKLQPAYSYQFRLCAVNDIGQSRYTTVMSANTAGSPPSQPLPPKVAEAGVKYLRLEWKGRETDDEYTLQMEDPTTGHGFLPVYNGSAPNYLCIGLKRNSQYRFRLRAQNEEGHSKWSDEVALYTLPDHPSPPNKPGLKGRVNAYGFKVRWDSPSDTGGVPIQAFALEIDQGNGYEEIYRGPEAECTVDRLSPGQSYALRAIAIGPGGGSDPSESCVITTEPVCPGKSHIPRIVGKPKSNTVHLKWSPPDWTGGSPINGYEVGCTTPDNQTQEAYRGKDTECIVNRLLPGRSYLFQIRAFNRIGAGDWSDPLEVISGAGQPDAPSLPKVVTKTSHIVLISWTEPLNNGSAIMEYKVQMASPTPPPTTTSPPTSTTNLSTPTESSSLDSTTAAVGGGDGIRPVVVEEVKSEIKEVIQHQQHSNHHHQNLSSFTQIYVGSSLSCEVKGLQPSSIYLFRVQATNGAGNSDWSSVATHEMPASSPNGVLGLEAVASCSSISLSWKTPLDNGSEITHYNVMMGETLHLVANSNQHVIDNLMPDTQHKIRVQAVNSVGPGPFSSPLKVWTKPLAPSPPKLECVSVAPFWMKLKWTEIPSKNIEYLVQMINPYKDEFEVVYRGTTSNCKVTRLSEDTEYQFRICALNGAGQGPFSDLYRFSTSKAPPSQIKTCKAELLKDSSTHRFEWMEVKCSIDTIEYQFQVASKKRDMDFKTMYRGTERRVELNHDQLEKGIDYACRVCAIRVSGDGAQLVGPYSNNVNFHVPLSSQAEDLLASSSSSSSKSHSLSSKSQINVTNTFLMTMEEKMSRISYESRVGIVAVLALIILAFVISLITHHVVS